MPQTQHHHQFKGFDDLIEVFRAGTHTDSKGRVNTFTTADLDQMVTNSEAQPAPAVLGHPTHDAPAYGWGKLKRVGESLFAKFTDVNPAFEKGVRDGAYRNRSVAVVKDPQQGWRVRHVGWLGAAAPAIDGLTPVSFSSGDESLEFSATFEQGTTMSHTQADIDKAVATARQEEQAKSAADKAAADKAISDAEAKFSAQCKEVAELRAERVKDKVATTINKLKAEGKVLPAQEAGLAEFMSSLEALPEQFEFSKADGKTKKTPAEYFAEFMASMPKLVKLGDGKGGADTDPGAAAEADPQKLADDARAYMADRAAKGVTVSLPDAIAHVSSKANA